MSWPESVFGCALVLAAALAVWAWAWWGRGFPGPKEKETIHYKQTMTFDPNTLYSWTGSPPPNPPPSTSGKPIKKK